MNFTQSFKLAIKSLRTSKARAILTMLGIIIGVAAVIIIISLGNGLTGMVEQQVEKVGINQIYAYNWGFGGGALTLDAQEIYDLVEERPDVFVGVTPWVNAGTGTRRGSEKYEKTNIFGVSEAFFNPELSTTLDGEQLEKGRFLGYVDVFRRSNVCVIGAYLEENAFDGDALGQGIIVGGVSYTVIGVMSRKSEVMEEGGGDDFVYIPYENALQLTGTRQVQLFQLTCTSRETSGLAKELLTELMLDFYGEQYSDNGQTFYIQTMAEQVAMINSMMGVAMAVLVAIAAISLLVGGIGIMNIMLVSVTERTREIGIRKSLGAKRRDIRRQFVIEAGTTSAIGGLLGIGFGCLMATAIGALMGGMLVEAMGVSGITFNAAPTFGAIAVSFGVSVGIGVLFGYLPANKAAKLNPIDALRYD
ncbi:ABC transporter permease [Oscillibacter sp.]|jgi:putative ABC transport system permease protein|uniref:ABC transporter permease n=3 Tax=Oscillibacter TaxID=459786 RepID=UPI002172447E|nr:ABC transporter permease [Oscillibacter sp.]MCI9649279.1 FtsX-like permease family protein [Oscillibacter sp.]